MKLFRNPYYSKPDNIRKYVIKRLSLMLFLLLLLVSSALLIPLSSTLASTLGINLGKYAKLPPKVNSGIHEKNIPQVLAEFDDLNEATSSPRINFNLVTNFKDNVYVDGDLLVQGKGIFPIGIEAPNVVYTITPGNGIRLSGDSQNVVIESDAVSSFQGQTGAIEITGGNGIRVDGLTITSTGVTSFAGQTGDVTLVAGDGIVISGNTISADSNITADTGSAQSIFKTIAVTGQSNIVASSNTDTLNFAPGTGITLTTDSSTKTVTISSSSILTDSGFSDDGTIVRLTDPNDSVGIGTSAPLSKFSVGTNSEFQVTNGGAIAAATGITSSGTITFSGLGGGGSQLIRVDNNGSIQVIPDGANGSFLGTDGAGNYIWSSPSGTGDITAVGSMTSGAAFRDTNANGQWLGLGAAAGRVEFNDLSTDTINILSANVGIGTSTPGYRLEVGGDIKVGDGGNSLILGSAATDPVSAPDGSLYYRSSDQRFRCREAGAWKFCDTSTSGPLSGSGTNGQVSFFSSTSTLSGSNAFFWDSVNNRLGIGTSTPGYALDVAGNINSSSVTTGTVETSGQAGVTVNPFGVSAGNTGEVRFSELAANGINYTGFKAPDNLTSNIIYTLPTADGSSNYVLSTNGSGVLSWTSISGVGSLTGSGTTNTIPRFTSTFTLGDSGFTDNGSVLGFTRDISFTAVTPNIAISNGETLTITDGTNTLLSLADGGTSGNLSGIGNFTAGGTITFSGLSTGIAHINSSGVVSSSAVNLASADVTGTVGIANGGTGVTATPSNGQLLIGNGTGYTLATLANGTGVNITNSSGSITITNTGVTSIAGTTNQVNTSASTGAVTLSLPQDIDTSANVNFGTVTTTGQGGLTVNPFGASAGNTGEVRFRELAAGGTNYVGFKAPDAVTSNTIWTLPSADGSSNYVLTTNGSGVLSWNSISGVGSLTGSGTTNTIPRFTSNFTLGDSGLTDDGSNIGITRDILFTASTPSIAITNGATLTITDGTNTLLSLADGGTVGNLSGIGNLTARGTVTFSNYGTGIAHFSSSGVITSSAVDLASGDVTGILSVSNGGTGIGTTATNGQLLIGNGTGYTLATITAGTGIGITNGSGAITVQNTGVTQITGTSNQVIASGGTGAVTLSLPQSINTTANVNFGSVTTSGQGGLVINPFGTSAGNTGEARFQELVTNGTNYTGFKAPDNLTSNILYTLPTGDGGNNYVLTTNGSGTLSWSSLSGTGAITGTGTTNTIPRFTGSSSLGDSGITDNGSVLGFTRDITFTASTPSIAITDGETISITDGTNTLLSLADAGTAGNLSGIGTLTAGGTVTFSNYGTGIAHFNSSGVLSSSAVNLASGDVTGTLTINKGGTGVSSTPTNGQLLIGNGTGYTLAGISAGTGIGVTNGSGSITIANTGVTSVTGTTNQINASGSTGAVTFSLPQNIDTSADVIFRSLTTSGQASVTANPYGTNAGETSEIRFKELVANGSQYVGFKAPNSVTGSIIWTLPAADGSSNYVLTTNGSGALSWNSIGGAGAITGSGTTNTLSRFTGANTIGDSGITDDGSVLGFTRDINFSASTPSIAISNGATLTITDGTNTLLSLADAGTSGNLSGINNLTAGGTITFSGLSTGIAHFSSGGVLSSSAVNLASADVTGILGVSNGGTGTNATPTNGQLLIGNGSGYSLTGLSSGTGIGITNGSGTITIANTGVTSVTGTTNQVNVSGSTGAVTFSLPQDINTGANVIFNSLTTNGQGSVIINPYGSNTGETSEIRFKELAANGSQYVGFKSPDSLTSSTIWTLPAADGSSNYVLTTNGSGALSWNSIGGAGALTGSGTTNTIPRFTGTSTLGDSGLTDNGTLIGIARDINFTATTPSIAITNAATLSITDGTNTLLSLADGGTVGNLSGIGTLTAGGTVTFSNYGTGIAHFSSGGVISSSAVDLASADVTGTLGIANGGTGTNATPSNGQLLIGNGTGYTLAAVTSGTGIGITNGSGSINIVNTGVTSVTGTTNQVNVSGSTGAVTFSLPQNINTSANVNFGSVTTSSQAGLTLNPFNTGGGNTSEIRFNELIANGTNYVGFKAPDNVTANTIWTLPSADGSSNYVLTTNGSGALSWNSIGGAGALTGSGTTNTIARFTGSNTLGDSGITDNGSLIGITRDISFTASTPNIAITNGETLTITDGTNTLLTLADAGTVGNLGGINNITFGGIISGAGGNATNPTYTFTGNTNTGLFSPGSNILAFGTNSNERARFDSNGYFGLGTTSPATRLDVVGASLNTDADNSVGIASFTQTITKNDTNTRTFYGVNIKPTLNTGGSNTNTTYNIFNIESVNTSTTGLTTNLFRAADGSITRFLVQQSGNIVNTATTTAGTAFQMNYNQITTGTGTGLVVNGLTSGNGLAVTSSATGITGNVALISASASNAAITGNVLKVENPGALSAATTLLVTNGGTGNSFRVNDDGTDTDASPFVIDADGNIGIGTATPLAALDVNGNARLQAQGELRFADSDSSNYVGFKAPGSVTSNTIWTLPASDGANNYVLATNGSGQLTWSSVSGVGSLTGSGTTNFISKFSGTSTITDSLLYDNGTNVGIGTSTPSTKLDVAGSIFARAQGEVRFGDSDSSNYVGFRAPGVVTSNAIWTLPASDGANNYVLATNGSGQLTWSSVSGVGSLTGSGTTNSIARFTGTSSIGDSGITDNGSVIGLTRDLVLSASTPSIAITNGETFTITDGTNTLFTLADNGTSATLGINAINASGTYSFNGSGANAIQLNPYGTSAGNTAETRFQELAANGSNYTGFKAPDSLTSNVIYTLPSADGGSNYVLSTSGSGVLSWVAQSSGITGSGTTNTIPRFTSSTALGDSGLTDNGSVIGISRDISFTASTPSIAITNTETFSITDGTNTLLSLADGGTVGNLSGIGNLTASGTITFSGLGSGIAHISSGGVISSSAVDLASADVTGVLGIAKGGTGTSSTPTNGQLLIGNGSGYTLATLSAGAGIGVTNGSGTINIVNTGVTSVTGTTNQVNVSGSTGSVTFSLPQNINTSANVNFGSVTTSGQSGLVINPFGTNAGETSEIRFRELAANGSNYTGFKSPDNLTASTVYTLPAADGTNDYVLTTDGAGGLNWESVAGIGAINGSGTINTIPRFTGTGTLGDSGLTDNGTVIGITRDISFTATTPSIAITNAATLTITDGTNTLLSLADGGTAGNLSGISNLTASGTVTFSGLGAGIAHFSSGGVLSSSAVNLASADITGTLAIGNGGTGTASTPTNGQLLIGNGSGYTLATISNGTGIGVTNGSGTISIVNTGVTSVTGTTNQVNVSGSTGAVTFSLPQSINTTANVNFGTLTTSGQAALTANPYGSSAGNTSEVRFKELAANGSEYVGFKSPDSLTASTIWTLPSADGSNNYVLTTNGSGALSWNSIGGTGGVTGSGTTNTIPRFTGTNTIGDSGITDNGSVIGISRDISFTATTPSISITNAETFTITDGTNTLLSLADGGTAGNLSGIANLTATGTITFSGLGSGIAHFSSGGVISSSAVNLASADVTGTLAIGNGGTGTASTPTNGQLLIGNGSGYTLATISGGTGIGVTNGSGTISLVNTGVTSVTGTTNQVNVSGSTGAVTFSLPQDINSTANVNFGSVTTSGQGGLVLNPYGSSAGNTSEVRFKELAANGSNYVGFKSPDNVTANTIWTLPSADGSNNYVLTTNGSGVTSWSSISGAGGLNGSGTTNSLARFTGTSTLGDSGITDNGSVLGFTRDINFSASTPSIAITDGETLRVTDGANTLLSLADAGTAGNLSGIADLTASGTITFSGLTTGIAHFSSGGVISSSAVNLASADVTGTLTINKGGTGTASTPTNGQLLIGNGTTYTLATISSGTGIGVTNGSGTITIANTGVTSVTGTANQVNVSGSTGAVTFSLPQDINTTANVNFGSLALNTQGALTLNPFNTSSGNTSEIRFKELAANGSNYVGFKSPDNLTATTIWTLPSADGSNNYVLTTNGSGVTSWSSISGAGGLNGSGTTNSLARFTSSSTLGDSGITDDGSVLGFTRDINFSATTPSIAITNAGTLTITDGTNTLLSLADGGTAGNLSGIANLTASGTVTFSGLGSGIAHFSSGGVISSSAVDLASADVTGTLGIGNGGTGTASTPTNGQLLIGNGTGYTLAAITSGTGIGVTNGSGTITIANTGVTSVTGTANQVNVSGSTGAVTFSLPQSINTTANVNFGSVTTSGQGGLVLNPFNTSAGNTGELRFGELAANGSNYVGFKAPDNITSNTIWTLPSADGSNNYVLTTNGSGVTSWASVSGVGGLSGSGTTNTIPRFTSTTALGDSGLTDNGSVIGITRDISFTAATPNIAITNGETLTITDGTNTLLSLADGGTVGNLSGIGTLTATGTVTFSNYGTGIAHFSSGGVISSSAVNLASSDVTGILGVTNGGTGTNSSFTTGSVVFAGASGVYSQDNNNFFFDDTNNYFGLGTSTPATRLDVNGLTLNTDADGTVGAARFLNSVTKNDTNTRTLYGVNINPTINTGGSNTNTTFNALNVQTTETSVTGTTLNLLRLASGSTQRFAVTNGGAFTMSTGAVAGNGLNLIANSLTSGNGITVNSSSATLSGNLGLFSSTGNATTLTGNILKVENTGASSVATTLMISNAGTGNGVRINDDGTDTDSTPFIIDASGNVAIGATTASTKLDINGDTRLLAQGDVRFADSDSSNYVGFQAPTTVTTNTIWTLPSADGSNNYVLTTNGSGTLSWNPVTGIGAGSITAVGSMTNGAVFADTTADDDWLGLGSTAGRIEFDDQSTDEVNILSARLGVGTSAPAALTDFLATTEQMRLSYDVSNYSSFTTNSGGDLTIAPSGLDTSITGRLDVGGSSSTITSGNLAQLATSLTVAAASNSSATFYAINSLALTAGSADYTNALFGGRFRTTNGSSGTLTEGNGIYSDILSNAGTITTAYGGRFATSIAVTGSIGTANGIFIGTALASGTGTITNNYGLNIAAQTAGTSDYGARIDAADTQTLWLSGNANNTTAAAGIAFGSSRDTNLYRGAADTLQTDDSLILNGTAGSANLTLNTQGDVRFADSDSSNYVGFQAPTTVTANTIWTLPSADGSNNYVLTTNGSGTLSWNSVTGIGAGTGTITAVGSITSGNAFSNTTADDQWLGLGSTAGRIEFDDQATDEVNILASYVGLGTSTPTSRLSFLADTTNTGGIVFGTDANFYRHAAGTLRTDNSLIVGTRTATLAAGDIMTSGSISLGNVSVAPLSSSVLDVVDSRTWSGGGNGQRILFNFLPGASGQTYMGSQTLARDVSSNTTSIAVLIGVRSSAQQQGSGDITNMYEFFGSTTLSNATGTVSNIYGSYNAPPNLTGSAINRYGTYISNPSGTGALTNNYGLYLENQTKGGSLNYSIYSAGGQSYFAGNVGIGTSTPSNALSVSTSNPSGTAAISSGLLRSSGTTNALGIDSSTTVTSSSSVGYASAYYGFLGLQGSGSVSNAAAGRFYGSIYGSALGTASIRGISLQADAQVAAAYVYGADVSGVGNIGSGAVTTVSGINIGSNINSGGGTISSSYGLNIAAQTAGTSDYGARIDAADTQTLWLSGNANNTTAAAGIAFGSSRDTNLYRGAADTLQTDDSLILNGTAGSANLTLNTQGDVRFADSDSSNYVGFQAPTTVTANTIWTLPSADGSNNYVLTTNGSGVLSWNSVTGVGGGNGTITAVGSITSGNAFSNTTADDQWLGLGSTAGRIEFDDQSTDEVNILNARLGVGTTAPLALANFQGTTEQLRLSYDASNYSTFTTDSGGDLTIAPSGGDTNITGVLDVSGVSAFGNGANSNSLYTMSVNHTQTSTGAARGINNILTYSPSGNSSVQVYGDETSLTHTANNSTGTLGAIRGLTTLSSTGTVSSAFGGQFGVTANSTTSLAIGLSTFVNAGITSPVTTIKGVDAAITTSGAAVTTASGLYVQSASGSGISNNYGLNIETQTAGTNNFGARIDAASTQTLWLSGNADNTNIASGIAFGSSRDTTLYRSAASTLSTGGNFQVNAQGDIRLADSDSSNYVGLQAPTSIGSNYTLTLPNAVAGGSNYALVSDASGNLTYQDITAVAAGADITAVGSMTNGAAFADTTADDDWLGLGSTAGRIEFDDQSTDEINFLGANVGIGTSTPTYLLDVQNNANSATVSRIGNSTAGTLATATQMFTSDSATGTIGVQSGSYTGGGSFAHFADRMLISAATDAGGLDLVAQAASGDMRFYTGGAATSNERMRLTSTGNLGLGTTTPTANFDLVSSNTTTNVFALTANSLTTGYAQSITSNSTGLTSGRLFNIEWNPSSTTTATGDLARLSINANANIGNFLNIVDDTTSLFSVSESAFTTSLPTSFTAPGDMSIAYDLAFTNQTASYIRSNAPLTLDTGESFESNDLSLITYNSGKIVASTGTGGMDLSTSSSGTQLRFGSNQLDEGGYLVSTAASNAVISGGASWDGSNWVAKSTTASSIAQVSGGITFNGDTGLTVGNTFTPTARWTFAAGGASTASSNATATTAYSFTANSVNTGSGLSLTTNALSSGTGLNITSNATSVTGRLLDVTASGSNAASTGQVARISATGSSFAGPVLMLSNAGTGLGLRVNDDGTDTDTTPVVVDASGRLGVGLAAPNWLTSIAGSQASSSIATIVNTNTANNTTTNVLRLGVGSSSSNTNPRFVIFYAGATADNNGTAVGHINLNNNAVNYATTGADYGEYFDINEPAEFGDMVAINQNGVGKADGTSTQLLGVISDTTGFTGNTPEAGSHPDAKPVGLMGQVSTKVDTSNGPIKKGDFITVSSVNRGVGAKAIASGFAVGQAMEDYSGGGIGKIRVMVASTYADLRNVSNRMTLDDNGFVKTDKFKANEIQIGPDGVDLMTTINNQLSALDSQATSINNLSTDFSSIQAQTDQRLAQIEHDVATMSASLAQVNSADVNKVASIEANLNILEQRTTTLEDTVASLSAKLNDLVLNGSAATDSGILATSSATLDDLTVTNNANVNNLGVTGTISAGNMMIEGLDALSESSINTLGGTLKIQSLAVNDVEFEAGKIRMDTQGNMTVEGSITTSKVKINTSDTLGASAGKNTIPAGQTSIIVDTTAVKPESLIFVTATSKTGQVLSVSNQVAGSSFTVNIPAASTQNINFNWWIVDAVSP